MNAVMWLIFRTLWKKWSWNFVFSKLIVADGDLCWLILTCNWRQLWWCMHVLKNVDVDCWWFFVWTYALIESYVRAFISRIFISILVMNGYLYPYWRWLEYFVFILAIKMIQMYPAVTTLVMTGTTCIYSRLLAHCITGHVSYLLMCLMNNCIGELYTWWNLVNICVDMKVYLCNYYTCMLDDY